jgi:dTDP-4-dehydrorhamnose 3,5-epimerase
VSSNSEIDGVVVNPLREIADERGAVLHFLRADAADFEQFGECYFSEVKPGAVKAWKRHRMQTQNFAVPSGRIRLVIFDDRDGSPSRGKVSEMELGRPDSYMRVRIPPYLWYGFAAIGSSAALLANCADRPHDPSDSETLPSDDPSIPYIWKA